MKMGLTQVLGYTATLNALLSAVKIITFRSI